MGKGDNVGTQITNRVLMVIFAVIEFTLGLALGETVISTVQGINSTNWTFPAASVLILVIGYAPLFYYLGVIMGFIAMMWAASKLS